MAATKKISDSELGNVMMRGGRKIAVERLDQRFTTLASNPAHLERIKATPGISTVKHVAHGVYKIDTTPGARDTVMASLRTSADRTVAHHAYRTKDHDETVYYLTDRIILRFKPGTGAAAMDGVLAKYRLKVVKAYGGDGLAVLVAVTDDSGENPLKIANRLTAEAAVESAEPNLINRFARTFRPPDTLFPRQWHLDAKDGPQLIAQAAVGAPAAWDITRGDRSIVVAVADDGFDLTHPDFQGPGKIVQPRDYVDGNSDPAPGSEDDYHGTPCAGVAIAESNGHGVVGVAHGCAFMPVRFPLSLDDDRLIELFEDVAKFAHVVSCSWGPVPVDAPISSQLSITLKRIATSGGPHGRGCVIVFAAANFNAPVSAPPNPAGVVWRDYTGIVHTTKGRIHNGLAAHPSVICVAASTSLNRHAAYSNWGRDVSVCAPSDNFDPMNSGAFVPGRGIWTTDNDKFGGGFTDDSPYTGNFGGTSSATPLVAGIAALVLSTNPKLTAAEVKDLLQRTADKIVDPNPDIHTNVNKGQYDASGHCEWCGYGKVNAAKAVAAALAKLQPTPAANNAKPAARQPRTSRRNRAHAA